ncbi:MAG: metal-dependent hydrolase [Endomicrobium sp.]|jgi:inner membrane protein|nr:metal-dependent hydrolase [Endomicrobium sp.]
MTGKTHAICGTAVMALITVKFPESLVLFEQDYTPAIGLATAAIGSYMPDIDMVQSKLGSKHKIIASLLTHRGITHTLFIPAILVLLMYYASLNGLPVIPELILGLNIGWVAHILADMFNKKGVPLLWPVYLGKIHIASLVTGTWHEAPFILIWMGGIVACWTLL